MLIWSNSSVFLYYGIIYELLVQEAMSWEILMFLRMPIDLAFLHLIY